MWAYSPASTQRTSPANGNEVRLGELPSAIGGPSWPFSFQPKPHRRPRSSTTIVVRTPVETRRARPSAATRVGRWKQAPHSGVAVSGCPRRPWKVEPHVITRPSARSAAAWNAPSATAAKREPSATWRGVAEQKDSQRPSAAPGSTTQAPSRHAPDDEHLVSVRQRSNAPWPMPSFASSLEPNAKSAPSSAIASTEPWYAATRRKVRSSRIGVGPATGS